MSTPSESCPETAGHRNAGRSPQPHPVRGR